MKFEDLVEVEVEMIWEKGMERPFVVPKEYEHPYWEVPPHTVRLFAVRPNLDD